MNLPTVSINETTSGVIVAATVFDANFSVFFEGRAANASVKSASSSKSNKFTEMRDLPFDTIILFA